MSISRLNKCWPYFLIMILLMAPPVSIAEQELDKPHTSVWRGISVSLHANHTDEDFRKISKWGANLVRVAIHANPDNRNYDKFYQNDGRSINPSAFTKLDQYIVYAKANDLEVLVDLHSFPGDGGEIWSDFSYWETLIQLCSFVAERYKGNDTVIGYAPINEPTLVRKFGSNLDTIKMRSGMWRFPEEWRDTPRDYFKLVEKIGKSINRIDPKKAVIVAGVGLYANPLNYQWMEAVDVENAIYAFNMYKPQQFGDSGKAGRPIVKYDREKQCPKMIQMMTHVKSFATKHDANVLVSAFGLPYHTEGMGAGQWMEDVISYFEESGWSWAYWSYSITFRNPEVVGLRKGVVNKNEDSERMRVLKKYWALNHGK